MNEIEVRNVANNRDGAGIEISFSGPAVNGGRMRLADFVESAHGLEMMIDAASRELLGGSAKSPVLEAQIDANFQRASFHFLVWLTNHALAVEVTTIALIKSDATPKALELIKSVFGVGASLIELIKASKGKEPSSSSTVITNNGNVQTQIIFEKGSNPIIVTPEVAKLFENRDLRAGAEAFVSPLLQTGVDEIAVRPDTEAMPSLIGKGEVKSFALPSQSVALEDESIRNYTDQIVDVVKSPFLADRRWRLFDRSGDFGEFGADMLDTAFTSRVTHREEFFGAGDRLKVDFTVRTYPSRREFFVTKVHGRIAPESPDQLSFF